MSEERAKTLGLPYARLLGDHRAAQRLRRRPGADARRLGARSRRSLRAGGRRPGRHGFRADLRRLSGDHRACSSRISASAARAKAPDFVRRHTLHLGRLLPAQHVAAASSRSARPAPPAARSAWSKRCASSPARPSGRQVKDAKLGLVCGFGMINYDRGLGSGAAILGSAMSCP